MAIIKIRNAAIDLDAAEIPNLPATKITSGTLDNARISLDAAEIPNLDTAKITTGTLADARVPNLNASKITAGTLADARVPDLNASKITAGTIATARLGSGTASSSTFLRGDNTFAEAGGGKILQVVQATKSDTGSWTGTQLRTDIGVQASITPSATSSKILIHWIVNIGYFEDNNQWFLHLDRNGTEIGQGDASSSRKSSHFAPLNYQATNQSYMSNSASGSFLDSPSSTSARTYKVQHSHTGNGGAFYLNRSKDDRQYTGYDNRGYSGIILIEVGA